MSDGRVSLGTFLVFTGLSLLLVLRGGPNDAYAGVLVFMIALLQLYEYGVWNDLSCNPGQSNAKAGKAAYITLWAMPAVLCLAAAFLGSNLVAEASSRSLLLGAGLMFSALLVSLALPTYMDKATWCSAPGNLWLPVWYFEKEKVPLALNPMWLLGVLLPTIFVDPQVLGIGTLVVAGGAYYAGRHVDPLDSGEWLSVTSLLANGIAVWALAAPKARELVFGPGVAF
jgi:hypothetical protein